MICLAARTNNCSISYSGYSPLGYSAELFLKIMAKFCYVIQTMRLIAVNSAQSIFLPFKKKKNKKAGPARKKAGKLVLFIFFYFARTKLLLRPDAIPSSRVFRRTALNHNKNQSKQPKDAVKSPRAVKQRGI